MPTAEYEPTYKVMARRVTRPSLLRAFFTNADDGVDGDFTWAQRTAGWSTWRRRLGWWARNSAHDFTFYWIGLVGLPVRTTGIEPRHPHLIDEQGIERDGFNRAALQPIDDAGNAGWRRPFWSWRTPRIVAYIGWRPPAGSFGLKFRRRSST